MSKFGKPQLLTILGAVALFVLLFLMPGIENSRPDDAVVETEADENVEPTFSEMEEDALSSLKDNEKSIIDRYNQLLKEAGSNEEKVMMLDSLSNYWKSFGFALIGAEKKREIALISPSEFTWFEAGDMYFSSFREPAGERKNMALKKAISCYEKVLEINPGALEAKTSLGVCYVEGASLLNSAPMKGIGMLKEVLKEDPNNINALVNLGYFAIQSGQYDKAEQRFNQILEIDPGYSQAYLYLAEMYASQRKLNKAVESLEQYKSYLTDVRQIEYISQYQEEIKRNLK